MTDKAKIAARIRALREKTVANGCTEEEAAAAAAMVASMLAKYNMTLDECEVRESGFARSESVFDDPVGDRLWKIGDALAHMIGVRYWTGRPGEPAKVTFFGFEHEVEIATYLLEICRYAMLSRQAELEHQYRLLRDTVRRRRIFPFLDGMADRLAFRIRELKPRTCPHMLYDGQCSLVRTLFGIPATILSLTGNSFTVEVAPHASTGWFDGGIAEWDADGLGTIEMRAIERGVSTTEFLMFGRTDGLAIGKTLVMYPGCDRLSETCNSKFNNLVNFGGITQMPGESPYGQNIF